MISLRCINRFSILLAQNDRLVLSFRLRGRSTSSLFKKSLSDRKGAGTSQVKKNNNNTFAVIWDHLINTKLYTGCA